MNSPSTVHPGLRDFMGRRGLPPESLRGNGRLALVIDGRYRLNFRPDIDGRLALSARVGPLPGERDSFETGQWLERMMNTGAGMLRDHASTLSIDPQGYGLLLQQSLAAHLSGEQLDAEVAEFVNALQFWVNTGKNA